MMGDLADLYTAIGGDIAAKDIKKHQDSTKKLLVRRVKYFLPWLYYFIVVFYRVRLINLEIWSQ